MNDILAKVTSLEKRQDALEKEMKELREAGGNGGSREHCIILMFEKDHVEKQLIVYFCDEQGEAPVETVVKT